MAEPGEEREEEMAEEGELISEDEAEETASFLPNFPTLEDFSKSLASQVMLATKAANGLPTERDDYDYYTSFPGFKTFTEKMGQRINRMISKVLRQQQLPCYWPSGNEGVEEKFEALVEANDVLMERVSVLLDEASGVTVTQQPILPHSEVQRGTAEVASWNVKRESVRSAVNSYSFIHSKSVERPQLKFRYQVDNSLSPFIPLLRDKPNAKVPLPQVFQKLQNPTSLSALIANAKEWAGSDHTHFHPYQYELDTLEYMSSQLELREPQTPGSLEDTPLTMVTTLEQLEALKKELMTVNEFAVDLEHHSYRSYVGFVCLMQVSTRCHDYLIDTLVLRHHMHTLLDPFTHPRIVKVLHGADFDIQWLQRDFGLYVVNMFDTGQASRALGLPRYSLAYLLQYCCKVEADKQFQLADWRIRPLPPEMIKYAREDTHYLLYIYDRMSNELIRRGNERGNLIRLVLDNSRDLCAKPYVKPVIKEDSYLKLYYKHKRKFNSQQLHCLQLLYKWRDDLARAEDESTGFVLPNHMLFQIAEILPREPQGVLACCNPIPTLLRQQVQEVNMLVQRARSTPLTELLPTMSSPTEESAMETATTLPVEATDSTDPNHKRRKVKVQGPPVGKADLKLTVFKSCHGDDVRDAEEKRKEVVRSFTNFLCLYLQPKVMTRYEVLQMHRSFNEAPIVSSGMESPVAKATLTTSTQNPGAINEGSAESAKRKHGKLSVREMGREEEGSGGGDSPPVRKKRKATNGKGKRKASDELTPFEYKGAEFDQFAKRGREVEVFDPHREGYAKEERRGSKSKVYQKFSERSHSYTQGKRGKKPSWPGGR